MPPPQFGTVPRGPDRLPRRWPVPLAVAAGVAVLAAVVLDPFHQVPSGYVGVQTWFGAVGGTQLDPGLHLVVPFVSEIHDLSVQPHTSVTDETAATHDQQNVETRTAVTWVVVPSSANEIYADFRTGPALERTIIAPIVSNDMKAVIAQYDAQELITARARVADQIATMITADLARHRVQVTVGGVNIVDMRFSPAYDAAIEQKQVAQQQSLQARYTLEQVQTSSQQQVVQARAAADATVAAAAGQARATVLLAEADAQAYRDKQAALSPELLRLTALQKWNGALPTYVGSGAPLPFLSAPGDR